MFFPGSIGRSLVAPFEPPASREDIATDPVLFVRAPDPKDDSWHRKVQHWTAPFSFSMLQPDSNRGGFKGKGGGTFNRLGG